MPIHNLGYREWNGPPGNPLSRWMVIAGIGIQRAWQIAWLRRIVFVAMIPGLVMAVLIFVFEQSEKNGNLGGSEVRPNVGLMIARGLLQASNASTAELNRVLDPGLSSDGRRHMMWSTLQLSLFRRCQPLLLIPIVGLIAPPLISQDFRSRAFLLYFSRPLTRLQYIVGKAGTVVFYLSLITLLPALGLFVAGLMLSPDLSVLRSTWDLPFRILAASAVIIIPSTALALMLSAMTSETRYASGGWFAIWIFGSLTYTSAIQFPGSHDSSLIQCVSLFHMFSDVSQWILEPQLPVRGIETQLTMLCVLTMVSLVVVYRRVSAPMQI